MKTALAAILCWALSACAALPAGVYMTDAERTSCAASEPERPCTVWSIQELGTVARQFFERGFAAGKQAERDSL